MSAGAAAPGADDGARTGPAPVRRQLRERQRGGAALRWVVDTHNDVLYAIERQNRDFRTRSAVAHTDLPRLIGSGMRLEFFSFYLPAEDKPDRALPRQLEIVDRFWKVVGGDTERFRPVLTRDDVLALDEDPRLGALVSLEGAAAVASPGVLRMFHRLGVRCIALAHNERNHLADGVGMGQGGRGLSPLGLEVVQEMQRLGILFDVSHLRPQGLWHYLEHSEGPFIASHSNARAVFEHARGLDDDQIRSIGARDGSIGLNFHPGFLRDVLTSVDDALAHADHILGLVGDRHAPIGADDDGIEETPAGLEDVTRLATLAEAMRRHGYSEETVRRIWARTCGVAGGGPAARYALAGSVAAAWPGRATGLPAPSPAAQARRPPDPAAKEGTPAKRPPSTASTAPVIKDAASDRSQTTARATSSAAPARPSGTAAPTCLRAAASAAARRSVTIGPGATAFTRTPAAA